MSCSICLNNMVGVQNTKSLKLTSCGHLFHKECIDKAIKKG